MKSKPCLFCKDKLTYIDYKDLNRIVQFTSMHAKIVPRYYTGTCLNHQKKLATAIKRARLIGFLPFVK